MNRIKGKIMMVTAMLSMTMLLSACVGKADVKDNEENGDNSLSVQTSGSQIEKDSPVSGKNTEDVAVTSDFDPEMWEILPEIPITDQGEFEYELEGEGVVVTNYLGNSSEVRIPDAFITENDGVLPVVGVNLDECEKELTELIVPNNADSIYLPNEIKNSLQYFNFSVAGVGSSALYNCPNLVAVYIPEGVENIKRSAFAYCKGLTSIIIPSSVTSIESAAFGFCTNLTSVEIRGDAKIVPGAFGWCTALTNVTLSDSITEISENTFDGCKSIIVTYKGNAYDYDHMDDLCDAINGGD